MDERMTPELLDQLRKWIANDNIHAFYVLYVWITTRSEVLIEDKYECQYCKKHGKYTKATMVHHVKHLKKHPELALSKFYIDEHGVKRRQLISLCNPCHEREHPERSASKENKEPLTPERW